MRTIRITAIVGPTACGKTRAGVALAHEHGTSIISADSRQVYRGLDIGTGKDLDEYCAVSPAVPCHMIDLVDPREPYTVFRYQQECFRLLERLADAPPYRDGAPVVLVGGTGLYVEAVLRDYRIADVPDDPALRRQLAERSHADLRRELCERDPALAEQTDLASTRRIIRALEIAAHAEREPVSYGEPLQVALESRVFVVEIDRAELRRRIDARLAARVEQGLIEEVAALLADGVPRARLDQLGLEYREVAAYLAGDVPREQMLERLRHAIHRFAKRQTTWFAGMPRRGLDVTSLTPDPSGV